MVCPGLLPFFLKSAARSMAEVIEKIDGNCDGEIHSTFASTIPTISFVVLRLIKKIIVCIQYYVSFRYTI